LRRYQQNYPADDPQRKAPPWDAVVELYWDDWPSMETAWASAEGAASDADLKLFADLERTTWSVVEELGGDIKSSRLQATGWREAPSR
jgi:hypothetical protein